MDLRKDIPFDIPTKSILIDAGIAQNANSLLRDMGSLQIICDENTADFVQLDAARAVLPEGQKADLEMAQNLAELDCDCFVAIGSGTINDITKYAAFFAGKPYVVFATAPSMNGYLSGNASLIKGGFKQSFPGKPPEAAFFDLNILESAPERLIYSGVGDALSRRTSQVDCLLAHILMGEESHDLEFSMMQEFEDEILQGGINIEALTKTLILGGVAMYVAGSSAPASQGEHMLAHYMELKNPHNQETFHGEEVAVTTCKMAALQAQIIQSGHMKEDFIPNDDLIIEHFGEELGEKFIMETADKYSRVTKHLWSGYEDFEPLLENLHEVEELLSKAGVPTTAAQLGWDEHIFEEAFSYAKFTRNRLTFLDLV